LLTESAVTLTGPAGNQNQPGATAFFGNVGKGTFSGNASAPGYSANSTGSFNVDFNANVSRQICLNELPCAVTVTVYDTSTNATLEGAFVSIGGSNSGTTTSNGRLQWSVLFDTVNQATASKTGYTSASGQIQCVRGGTQNINLYLTPLPSSVTVIVTDCRTGRLITESSVTLTGGASPQNLPGATAFFGNVGRGTFSANASAPGYSTNSTGSFNVDLNANITRQICLNELPCAVTVTVYDTSTNATLEGAFVTIGGSNFGTTTSNGRLQWSVLFDTVNLASANKTGYTSASGQIQCVRGGTQNINLYLSPILNSVIIEVRNARTNALITTASVTMTPGYTTARPVDTTLAQVNYGDRVPAGNYVATATAPGYNSNSTSFSVTFGQSVFRTIYLLELPCTVNVYTVDNSTGAFLNGVQVVTNNASLQTFTTANGQPVTYTFFTGQATSVTGSRPTYSTGVAQIDKCGFGVTVNVTIYLSPLPSSITIQVLDARTGAQITTANVTLTPTGGVQAVNGSAMAYYFPLGAGTYGASAVAPGYGPNSTSGLVLNFNSSLFAIIYLSELQCVVNVYTYDNSTGLLLANVTVTTNAPALPVQTTTATGMVSYTFLSNVANQVNGTRVGYTSASSGFTCRPGITVNVSLYLSPQPNRLTIQVKDVDTNENITTATVTLVGDNGYRTTRNVSSDFAIVNYNPIGYGTYSANASAPGYAPNGTNIGLITYNENRFVIIYLKQLPCTVVVKVVLRGTTTPIPGANVTFSDEGVYNPLFPNVYLTNATGQVTITQQGDFPDFVFATKVGYDNASDFYFCAPGTVQYVDLELQQVFLVTVYAVDVQDNTPIPFARIFLNSILISRTDPVRGPAFHLAEVNELPTSFTSFTAVAPGYLNQGFPGPVSFNLTVREAYLSLTPVSFTVFFIISELYDNGTSVLYYQPTLSSGYVPSAGELYAPANDQQIGGSTRRAQGSVSGTVESSPYGPNDVANFTAIWTSKYSQVTPSTAVNPFLILPTNLTHFSQNFNTTTNQAGAYNVRIPAYTETDIRILLFPLPYRANAAFVLVRGLPYLSDKTTRSTFPSSVAQTNFDIVFTSDAAGTSLNFKSLAPLGSAPATAATVELLFDFGTYIYDCRVAYAFEIFDQTASGFINPNGGAVIPQASQSATLFQTTFPTQAFFNSLFTTLPNGQIARKANSKFYIIYDYKLTYLPGLTPSTAKKRAVN
jgi:hypothetical protein